MDMLAARLNMLLSDFTMLFFFEVEHFAPAICIYSASLVDPLPSNPEAVVR